jgi:hypothetical protein
MPFVADDEAPDIAQPGEAPRALPASALAPERASIRRLGAGASAAMRRQHLQAQRGKGVIHKGVIQRSGVVGAVADPALGQLGEEAGDAGGSDAGGSDAGGSDAGGSDAGARMRRSRSGTRGERKSSAVCLRGHCHELGPFAACGRPLRNCFERVAVW